MSRPLLLIALAATLVACQNTGPVPPPSVHPTTTVSASPCPQPFEAALAFLMHQGQLQRFDLGRATMTPVGTAWQFTFRSERQLDFFTQTTPARLNYRELTMDGTWSGDVAQTFKAKVEIVERGPDLNQPSRITLTDDQASIRIYYASQSVTATNAPGRPMALAGRAVGTDSQSKAPYVIEFDVSYRIGTPVTQ